MVEVKSTRLKSEESGKADEKGTIRRDRRVGVNFMTTGRSRGNQGVCCKRDVDRKSLEVHLEEQHRVEDRRRY